MTNFSRQKENLLHEKMVSLPFPFYHFVTASETECTIGEFFLLRNLKPL